MKEGNVLFNDALNTFYLRLYGSFSVSKTTLFYVFITHCIICVDQERDLFQCFVLCTNLSTTCEKVTWQAVVIYNNYNITLA